MAEEFKTYALGGARAGVEGGFQPGDDDPFYTGLGSQQRDFIFKGFKAITASIG